MPPPQCCKQDEVKKALPIIGSLPLLSIQWDQVCLEQGSCGWVEDECQVPMLDTWNPTPRALATMLVLSLRLSDPQQIADQGWG